MDAHIEGLSKNSFATVREICRQVRGLRPKKENFHVGRNQRDRRRESPYRDIESMTQRDLADAIREDADRPVRGGSISDALRHTFEIAHKRNRRRGGGLASAKQLLENVVSSAGMNVDVAADKVLDTLGLRRSQYRNGKINDLHSLHAKLHDDVYKPVGQRGTVDGWEYQPTESTEHYGTYVQGKNAIMVHRGTDPGSLARLSNDLVDDLHIATSYTEHSSSLGDANRALEKLLDKYDSVNLSAYSRGMGVATDLYQKHKARLGSENVSIAGGMSLAHEHAKSIATDQKWHHVYQHSDVVSAGLSAHKRDNHTVLYDDALTGHTDILRRLKDKK